MEWGSMEVWEGDAPAEPLIRREPHPPILPYFTSFAH
jgi:hypothetical protein